MNLIVDPLKGKAIPVFLYYSLPSVISMLAVSGAVITDGFFIGNYSGQDGLAAVNLTVPVTALMVGLALMVSVGGAVRCGRYLGMGDTAAANRVFSQTIILTVIVSLSASIIFVVFNNTIVRLLGANDAIHAMTSEYLRMYMMFNIFQMGLVSISCFLRLDGFPVLTASILIGGSILNIFLDWIFVVKLGMGHKGAAIGTGISETMTTLMMLIPFISGKTRLKFNWNTSGVSEALRAAFNGFSEFSNEVSAGTITFVINIIIMKQIGESGVAAFSVINYIILCGLIINCGISEAIQPVVSKNYGAMKANRIIRITGISTIAVFSMGIIFSAALFLAPGFLTSLFIKSGNPETISIAKGFIATVWPVFLLNGLNIIMSSYLTSMNLAFYSTVVSLSRNLLFPVLFLTLVPGLSGHQNIFIALPLSELATLFIALVLVIRNSPSKLIKNLNDQSNGEPHIL